VPKTNQTEPASATASRCPWGRGDERREPITVSIGVGTSAEAISADALLKLADERLDAGKRAGRNRVIGSA
jgi:GGDEF domain-containing protein